LAALALGRLHAAGTPCRLELLFGLPVRRLLQLARLVGVAVRLYVPYGHAFLPYRRSQCTVRPAIASWAARDVLRGRSPWPAATAAAKG
jgi:proline dehydrogenase